MAEEYVFDFKEIVEYCISDVEILAVACLKFRQQLLDTTNVCPFTEASTIASARNKVFRRIFLQARSTGIIPKGGYRFRDNQSEIALHWLAYEEHSRSIKIRHAGNGFEARLGSLKVDGYCKETNQVFESLGCFYYGCQCLTSGRLTPLDDKFDTLDTGFERTARKIEHLKSKGYEVIEMRQCEFERLKKNNPELGEYSSLYLKNTPLRRRDEFYRGRTGNIVEYCRAQEGEESR